MRRPTTVVIDAAILVAAVRGRSSGALLAAAGKVILVTTDRVVQEARRRIALGLQRPELLDVLDDLSELLTIVPVASLEPVIARCEGLFAMPCRAAMDRCAMPMCSRWRGASRPMSGPPTATSPEPASQHGRRPISCER